MQLSLRQLKRAQSDEPGAVRFEVADETAPDFGETLNGLLVQCGSENITYRIPLRPRFFRRGRGREPHLETSVSVPFVPAHELQPEELADWWDGVALSDAEQTVSDALGTITKIERIATVKSYPRGRIFIVRLKGWDEPVTLRSLGDGMLRMFQIALALEPSHMEQRGRQLSLFPATQPTVEGSGRWLSPRNILLIDEIENGIHYSVLPQLWRFVFQSAKRNNIQVFATTHSWNCIEGFQEAAKSQPLDAALIRLERDGQETRSVEFSKEELQIVTRDHIEVR